MCPVHGSIMPINSAGYRPYRILVHFLDVLRCHTFGSMTFGHWICWLAHSWRISCSNPFIWRSPIFGLYLFSYLWVIFIQKRLIYRLAHNRSCHVFVVSVGWVHQRLHYSQCILSPIEWDTATSSGVCCLLNFHWHNHWCDCCWNYSNTNAWCDMQNASAVLSKEALSIDEWTQKTLINQRKS